MVENYNPTVTPMAAVTLLYLAANSIRDGVNSSAGAAFASSLPDITTRMSSESRPVSADLDPRYNSRAAVYASRADLGQVVLRPLRTRREAESFGLRDTN